MCNPRCWVSTALLGALLAIGPVSAQVALQDLVFEAIAVDLDRPVSIANAGDGSGRLFIVQQRGQVLIYDGSAVLDTPFLDISEQVRCCGERGLLDIAFHPEFATNGYFYVDYTDNEGTTNVARFHVSGDPNIADVASETLVLAIEQPDRIHNAGQLQFGPDGFLYISTGDGGPSKDPENRAQSLSTLLGKILRIDVDGAAPYAIPADNPFFGQEGARGEIWVYGLRNPWRFSFDRLTGDMFIADVGEARWEEISFQSGSSAGGENYGWRRFEGSECFNPAGSPFGPDELPAECLDPSFVAPIIAYEHFQGSCRGSVTGGYVYRGSEIAELQGKYVYGDFCNGQFHAAAPDGAGGWSSTLIRDTTVDITSFGEDEQGELYFAEIESESVFRIKAPNLGPVPVLTSTTSERHVSGGSDIEIVAVGAGFVPATVLQWNGESRPTAVFDETRLRATIAATDVAAPGMNAITVSTPPPGGGVSEAREFEVLPDPGLAPMIYDGGAVNAASFVADLPVAPGSIMSVFGESLSAFEEAFGSSLVPTGLGGGALVFSVNPPDGKGVSPSSFVDRIRVPLYFSSPGQINGQVPWELAGSGGVLLQAQVGGALSVPIAVTLATYSPGLFILGGGQAAATIGAAGGLVAGPEGSSPAYESRPIRRQEFLEIFCNGLGPVTNQPETGEPTSGNPLSETTTLPTVTVGGVAVAVFFSGIVPGTSALYQVNVQISDAVPSGEAVPVALTIGGLTSNVATIAVE